MEEYESTQDFARIEKLLKEKALLKKTFKNQITEIEEVMKQMKNKMFKLDPYYYKKHKIDEI